jgi:hypothetical protein
MVYWVAAVMLVGAVSMFLDRDIQRLQLEHSGEPARRIGTGLRWFRPGMNSAHASGLLSHGLTLNSIKSIIAALKPKSGLPSPIVSEPLVIVPEP